MKYLLYIGFLFICSMNGTAQERDSLWKIWTNEDSSDSLRLSSLHQIARQYMYSDPDSCLLLAEEELNYARQINNTGWESKALNLKGGAYWMKRNFAAALDAFQQSYELRKASNYLEGMSESLNNIGNIYYIQGHFTKALDYFVRSLKLEEESGHRAGFADSYLNIATIHAELEEYDKALEYMQAALDLYRELDNQGGTASTYNNMGNVLKAKGDLDSALQMFLAAFTLQEKLNIKSNLAITLTNIANTYVEQQRYSDALQYYEKSLDFYRRTGNQEGEAFIQASMGEMHRRMGALNKAEIHCKKALSLARSIGVLPEEKEAAHCLYLVHKALGNSERALDYYEIHSQLEKDFHRDETSKQLARLEFEKQVIADSLKREEERLRIEAHHKQEMLRENNRKRAYLFGGLSMLILAGALFGRVRYIRKAKTKIAGEKERSDKLLLNILPAEVAEELKQKGEAVAREFQDVTVLFSDFKNFTALSEHLTPQELVAELNICFRAFDEIITKYGIEKIKTIGDAYMAAGGLPVSRPDSASNTVKAALEMQAYMAERKIVTEGSEHPGFEMRLGIHSGNVVAGIVGYRKFQYDIWGDAVNTASRMETTGAVGKVNISKATYELIMDDPDFVFESRGKIAVKGKSEMDMYFVDWKTTPA